MWILEFLIKQLIKFVVQKIVLLLIIGEKQQAGGPYRLSRVLVPNFASAAVGTPYWFCFGTKCEFWNFPL